MFVVCLFACLRGLDTFVCLFVVVVCFFFVLFCFVSSQLYANETTFGISYGCTADYNLSEKGSNLIGKNLLPFVFLLTLKMPRKPASENVVCSCRLLNILANFSSLFLHTGKQCGP